MYLRTMIVAGTLVDTLGITLDISSMRYRAWDKDQRLMYQIRQKVHIPRAAHNIPTMPVSCKVLKQVVSQCEGLGSLDYLARHIHSVLDCRAGDSFVTKKFVCKPQCFRNCFISGSAVWAVMTITGDGERRPVHSTRSTTKGPKPGER